MEYFISFLEGVITFISPCLLPMLPIYLSFFAGGVPGEHPGKTLRNALAFVAGFTMVFVLLGVFAGAAGRLLSAHQTAVNLVSGLIVVVFGLNFMGVLKIPLLNRTFRPRADTAEMGTLSSLLFGIVFSVGWTPCVGVFLGSALMLASQQGSVLKGVLMLLCYSAGLGIPFVAAALLIDRLKSAFAFIKRHYAVINVASGVLLVIVGLLMMSGYMNYFLALLTF